MLPTEWVVGFVEGEGTFSGSTRNYDYFQPQFSVYQKDRRILDEMVQFLAEHGIPGARVYVSKSCHVLTVTGRPRCRSIYNLLRPHMHAQVKIEQIEAWYAKIQPNPETAKHGSPRYKEQVAGV